MQNQQTNQTRPRLSGGNYPSRRITEDYIITDPVVITALAEATALELQYDQLVRGVQFMSSDAELQQRLISIEEQLLHYYTIISRVFNHDTATDGARQMLAEMRMIIRQQDVY